MSSYKHKHYFLDKTFLHYILVTTIKYLPLQIRKIRLSGSKWKLDAPSIRHDKSVRWPNQVLSDSKYYNLSINKRKKLPFDSIWTWNNFNNTLPILWIFDKHRIVWKNLSVNTVIYNIARPTCNKMTRRNSLFCAIV